jgi:hypothetical protein
MKNETVYCVVGVHAKTKKEIFRKKNLNFQEAKRLADDKNDDVRKLNENINHYYSIVPQE